MGVTLAAGREIRAVVGVVIAAGISNEIAADVLAR